MMSFTETVARTQARMIDDDASWAPQPELPMQQPPPQQCAGREAVEDKANPSNKAADDMDGVGDNSSSAASAIDSRALEKTKMCRFFAKGQCGSGDDCSFAHGREQLRPQPDLYRTKLCVHYLNGGCRHEARCRYAHGNTEVRPSDRVKPLKTTPDKRSPAGAAATPATSAGAAGDQGACAPSSPTTPDHLVVALAHELEMVMRKAGRLQAELRKLKETPADGEEMAGPSAAQKAFDLLWAPLSTPSTPSEMHEVGTPCEGSVGWLPGALHGLPSTPPAMLRLAPSRSAQRQRTRPIPPEERSCSAGQGIRGHKLSPEGAAAATRADVSVGPRSTPPAAQLQQMSRQQAPPTAMAPSRGMATCGEAHTTLRSGNYCQEEIMTPASARRTLEQQTFNASWLAAPAPVQGRYGGAAAHKTQNQDKILPVLGGKRGPGWAFLRKAAGMVDEDFPYQDSGYAAPGGPLADDQNATYGDDRVVASTLMERLSRAPIGVRPHLLQSRPKFAMQEMRCCDFVDRDTCDAIAGGDPGTADHCITGDDEDGLEGRRPFANSDGMQSSEPVLEDVVADKEEDGVFRVELIVRNTFLNLVPVAGRTSSRRRTRSAHSVL